MTTTRRILGAGLLVLAIALTPTPLHAQNRTDYDAIELILATGDLPARLRALAPLVQDPSAEAETLLELATVDAAPEVRQLGWRGLLMRDVPLDRVRTGLADPSSRVRSTVVATLAPLPDTVKPDSESARMRADLLLEALDSQDIETRLTALETFTRLPRGLLPSCEVAVVGWQQLQEDASTHTMLEREGRAWLIDQVLASAQDCGLSVDEAQEVSNQAQRFAAFVRNPEMNLAQRDYAVRLVRAQERLDLLQPSSDARHNVLCIERAETTWGYFDDLLARAHEAGRLAIGADEETMARALDAFDRVDRYVDELEACYQEYYWGGFGGATLDPVQFWAQAAFESWYDDHVLARRDDVERLRITDQVTQRYAAQMEWNSEKRLLNGPVLFAIDKVFHRVRSEVSAEIFFGESQLNGPGGWLDYYGHWSLDHHNWFFWLAEAEWDQGMLDRGWPSQLVAQGGHFQALAGWREGFVTELPGFAVALALMGDVYPALATLSPSREADVDPFAFPPPATTLAPDDITTASRLGAELKSFFSIGDRELGLLVDMAARTWWYPVGMPTRLSDGTETTRTSPMFLGRIEPGFYWVEDEFLVLVALGATFGLYPEPTDSPIVRFTGRLHTEFAQTDRNQEGGQMYADLIGQLIDGPGVEDGLYGVELQGGFTIWVPDGEVYFEFDLPVFLSFYTRDLLLDVDDSNVLRAGIGLWGHLTFEDSPIFSLGYQLTGELDELRENRFSPNSGQEEDPSIIRNMVMLSIRAHHNGHNISFDDARAPEWGLSGVNDPVLPPYWRP